MELTKPHPSAWAAYLLILCQLTDMSELGSGEAVEVGDLVSSGLGLLEEAVPM